MSKIFFDHLIHLDEIKYHIDMIFKDPDEKVDIWNLIDVYINHRVVSLILSNLDEEYHEEFTVIFLDQPFNIGLVNYFDSKSLVPLNVLLDNNRNLILDELKKILEIESKTVSKTKRKNSKKKKT